MYIYGINSNQFKFWNKYDIIQRFYLEFFKFSQSVLCGYQSLFISFDELLSLILSSYITVSLRNFKKYIIFVIGLIKIKEENNQFFILSSKFSFVLVYSCFNTDIICVEFKLVGCIHQCDEQHLGLY